MRPRELALLFLALPLPGCALFRRPAVDVEHLRVELESGVEYVDEMEGVGRPATPEDEVTLDYTGWLEDGTPFDSSVDRGVPVTFVIDEAPLEGWRQGLPGMKAGGVRRLWLPPEAAYGEEGVPGLVPPWTGLVFVVELLAIEGEEPPALPPRSQRLQPRFEEDMLDVGREDPDEEEDGDVEDGDAGAPPPDGTVPESSDAQPDDGRR